MSKSPEQKIPAIIGVGGATGKNVITNERIAEILGKKSDSIRRMMGITGAGIEERRWVNSPILGHPDSLADVDPKEKEPWKGRGLEVAASDLGVEALREAAKMAHVDLNTIRAIHGASGSQDLRAVAVAALIQSKLDLPHDVRTYDAYAACPGWVHALSNSFNSLDSRYGEGGPQAAIGAEVISPILNKNRPALFVLFGDAAGATITDMVVPDEGAPTAMAFRFGTDGSLAEELCMPGGGSKFPTSERTLALDLETLVMNGDLVAENAVKYMAQATKAAIAAAGYQKEDIDWVIPHQANRGIMNKTYDAVMGIDRTTMGNVADEAGIPYHKMVSTVEKYGNTSTASIPTAMRDAISDGRVQRNQLVVVTSFGAGLNYGAAVLPMVGLPGKA